MSTILNYKRLIAFASAIILALSLFIFIKPAKAAVPISELNAGDLIRGERFSAVYYYGRDGMRYVFPNEKTYLTWYNNFDNIVWLSDADLGTIQIGGNVTYKPGSKMIKINSDPKTYAVGENGNLHWITNEAVAIALYGTDWNKKIDDVPDAFFSNYTRSNEIINSNDFDPVAQNSSATDINKDKDIKSPSVIMIQNNAFSNTTLTIKAGTAIKWINKDNAKHSATADNLKWGTGTLNLGQNFIKYFKVPGTYTYKCSYHPNTMTATIIVE